MDAKKREIRTLECALSVRENEQGKGSQGESRTIEGTAIVFNRESEVLDDWGYRFREVILPSAATQQFLNSMDIKMNMLHERDLTVARCNKGEGSMRLWTDKRGVHFEFEAPKCDIGDRCLEMVRRGDYSGCSFEFYPDEYDVEEREGGKDVKITHRKFKALTALTIGMDPAYTATSVNARELYDNTPTGKAEKEAQEKADREAKEKQEREEREAKEREEREKAEAMKREMNRRLEHMRRMGDFNKKLESTTF